MRSVLRATAIVTLLAVLPTPGIAHAESSTDAPHRAARFEGTVPFERIESMRKVALTRRLALSEDETARLFPQLDQNSEARWRLFRAMREARQAVHRRAQGPETETDDLHAAVAKLFDIEQDMLALRRTEYGQVEAVVGERRALRYLIFEHHFRERVEQLVRERNQRPRDEERPRGDEERASTPTP